MIESKIEPIINEFKQELKKLYGNRLADLVLFGSYARGDFNEDSDIDLMVLLNDDHVSTFTEIRRISDIETPLLLKYGMVLSPIPVSYTKYQTSSIPVYQEARRHGISI
nr:nucleotidyltransferase domain-containing protein [uncultured Arsenicibacter sp.]